MAFAVLVITVLTFGPSLDAIVCRDDGRLGAVAAEMPTAHVPPAHDAAPHSDDGAGLCAHGHCHHGVVYAPVAPAAAEVPYDRIGVPGLPSRERVRAADRQFGLMRPPRG
jgi:hypothetical protein